MRLGRPRMAALVAAAALTLGTAGAVKASHLGSATLGHSTLEQRLVGAGDGPFRTLATAPGEAHLLREDAGAVSKPGREARRRSLAYFGQLSDMHVTDEESPARVEFVDAIDNPSPFTSAWRPWEALVPQINDAGIRQLNRFTGASPVTAGDGSRRAMDFTITTGDAADSQQLNETEWVRTLLEGGALDPNSGVDPASLPANPLCPPLLTPGAAEAAGYTGVQDFGDYAEGPAPQFYDPGDARGLFGDWPSYPGLMDRAQQPFTAAGVDVPTYVTFGNHDGLVQGNQAANRAFEDVATGCIKPMEGAVADPRNLAEVLTSITPDGLLATLTSDPNDLILVPPDPDRRFVSKEDYKDVFLGSSQADGHGFAHIDPAEQAASGGAAGYYDWSPLPGIRFIALDTVSEGGVAGPSAEGNLDDPQFRWLEAELQKATAADELVFVFSHHAIASLNSPVPDEASGPCTAADPHGHDVNPGCDVDPRASTPIHLGADLTGLMHEYPHAVAWVAGHSHVNSIEPFPGPNGGGFWSIRTASEVDWPQQNRLLEVMDNGDGTLSIFGTVLDHASPVDAPAPDTNAAGMSEDELASLGRTISYNDPQTGAQECTPACGEGAADDRNVELVIYDPRRTAVGGGGGEPGQGCHGAIRGTRGPDRMDGTARDDILEGLRGNDVIHSRAGNDCVRAGRGRDRVFGGTDNDLIHGGGGRDRLKGDRGTDLIRGGRGRDRIHVRDGERDTVVCGKGRDVVVADRLDKVKGCERVRRRG